MNIPIENITVSYLQYYMTDFIDIIIELNENSWNVPSLSGKSATGYCVKLIMAACTSCGDETIEMCTMSECNKAVLPHVQM